MCDGVPLPDTTQQQKQKRCSKCEEEKPVTEFSKHPCTKDRLHSSCKECKRAAAKVYRRKYAYKNKNRFIDPDATKKCPSCGEVKAAGRFNRNKSNSDGLCSICKECDSAKTSKWAKANPEKCRAQSQRRRACKANAEGRFTAGEWRFTLKVLDYRCIYCGVRKDDTPEKWLEADHVVPLSRGGTNWISNIVPACKSCNCSKGTKTFDEYLEYLNGKEKIQDRSS